MPCCLRLLAIRVAPSISLMVPPRDRLNFGPRDYAWMAGSRLLSDVRCSPAMRFRAFWALLAKTEPGLRAFITRNLTRLGINLEPIRPPGRPGGRLRRDVARSSPRG